MIEGKFNTWNVTAAEDLLADKLFKCVSIAGTIAAGPSLALGILRSTVKSGGQASVVYEGLTKVIVGGAVSTPGFPLKIAATSGYLVAAASGDLHIGRALSTAASGDLVAALVDFNTKPAWNGL